MAACSRYARLGPTTAAEPSVTHAERCARWGVAAVISAVAVVGCGGHAPTGTQGSAFRQPVPLPPETLTIVTEAPTVPTTTTTTTAPTTTTAAPTTAAPTSTAAPTTTATTSPAAPGCALETLPAGAPPAEVAAAFVTTYGTVTAAGDQAARLRCLRVRLADPLTSPTLVAPSFTPDQVASHWQLRLTRPPAFAPDDDSRQSPDHVVLAGTMWAEVDQDGAAPSPTVSQLLVELVRPNGLWLVATMSNRTVGS
jgi:hypothetical protein